MPIRGSFDRERQRRQTLRTAMRGVANHRRCPKCERGAALSRNLSNSSFEVVRKCRYCGHVVYFANFANLGEP